MTQPTLIGSVQKALRLLEAVSASEDLVSAKKLSRLAGLPLPTTYHLLRTLTFEGYLHKADGGYHLGPSVLNAQSTSMQELLPRIRPVLRSLSDELGGATYLSVFQDGEIRLVAIADGPENQCVDLWVGVHESGHATAFGKAILASLDAEHRDDYINRHDLFDLTPNTITSRGGLERSLASPTQVWADAEEYLLGVSCLAAPIRGPGVVGAVAVSLPSNRPVTDIESLSLRRAARRLGMAMQDPLITI